VKGADSDLEARAAERQSAARINREDLVAFERGSGDLRTLGQLVRREWMPLSMRLDVIDIALARGMVTPDEISGPSSAPQPENFGAGEHAPSVLPTGVKDWAIGHYELIAPIYALTVAGSSLAFVASYELDLIEVILAGGLLAFFLVFLIPVLAGILINVIDGLLPGAAAWRRYAKALERHEVLGDVRAVWSLESEYRALKNASGSEFERLVARAFRRAGYRVEEKGGIGDEGVDLVAIKPGVHAIIQCKAHGKAVSPAVVRELYGALKHEGASIAYLATTNGVSDNARAWAADKAIRFIEPEDLIKRRGL
jgi:hypothetical protein